MESKFSGKLWGLICLRVKQFLLCLVTLTIGTPWAICMGERWVANHTIIDNKQIIFEGKGIQLLGNMIKWFFLTLITVGIYSLWVPLKYKAWVIYHTHAVDVVAEEAPAAEEAKAEAEAEAPALPEAAKEA